MTRFQRERVPGPPLQMDKEAPEQPGGSVMVPGHVRDRAGRIAARQPRASLQAGFQLIEMLIAVAIVAIIGIIAIPSYSSHIDKANRATAETDITIIVQSIEQYFLENRAYPNSLDDIGLGTKLDPWDNTYYYQRIAGANLAGKGKLRKDKNLNPVNSDYDLYGAGKDGQTKLPFPSKVSHDDIVRASNGRFIGYAADF